MYVHDCNDAELMTTPDTRLKGTCSDVQFSLQWEKIRLRGNNKAAQEALVS